MPLQPHRLYAIAPYFATFPQSFATSQVLAGSRPGGVVFDPFAGRGTAILAALLAGREAAGCDLNPVAVCIAGAACDPPTLEEVEDRISEMEESPRPAPEVPDEFFALCFHPDTLAQIATLRGNLDWRRSRVDRFIAAVVLSVLQNDPTRTPNGLSNRLPRVIAPKKEYSVRWWLRNGWTEPPQRDVYAIVRRAAAMRLSDGPPPMRGAIAEADARRSAEAFPSLRGRVSLVVTSPPYLDTTDFLEDCWLRGWVLGGPPQPVRGGRRNGDGRHRAEAAWWRFLTEAFAGVAPLLATEAIVALRVGLARREPQETVGILREVLSQGLDGSVEMLSYGISPIPRRITRTVQEGAKGHGREIDAVFRITR